MGYIRFAENRECNTFRGLFLLIIGFCLTTISSFIIALLSFFLHDDFSIIGFIMLLGIISLIGALIILVGAILFLIGRKEFGPKHQKNVINAVIVFLINIVMVVVLASAMIYLIVTSALFNDNTGPYPAIFIIISVVSACLGGLTYYYALIELENDHGKTVLYIAIIASIIISVIVSSFVLGSFGDLYEPVESDVNDFNYSYSQGSNGIEFLNALPGLLFIYAIYIPYKRIRDGELVPQVKQSFGSTYPSRMCPNCGRGIPMDALICPYCGKRFEDHI